MQICGPSLWAFYRRNNIRQRFANYSHTHVKSAEWLQLKRAFVIKLAQLIRDRKPLCYMDESSFNSWMRTRKTYKGAKDNIKIVVPKTRSAGVTVFGCIGNCIRGGWLHMLAKSTNSADTRTFFSLIRASATVARDEEIVVVLDNASAHRGMGATEHFAALGVKALYMPPYSPELNSIEMVWGRVKERVKAELAQVVQTLAIDSTRFTQIVQRALAITPEEAAKAMLNNRHALSAELGATEAD